MIDFKKPLECDHGEVLAVDGNEKHQQRVMVDSVYFWVCKSDGVPMSSKLTNKFTVRNKKTNRDMAISEIWKIYRMHYEVMSQTGAPDAGEVVDALIAAGLLKED